MVTTPATSGSELRLAELLATLSLGVDLGFDQPMEHLLRQTVIAMRPAERLGINAGRPTLYDTSLLVNVGWHSDAYEQATWFGDDIARKADKYRHDQRSLRSFLAGLDSLWTWKTVIDAEPALPRRLLGSQVDEALGTISDFVDLQSQHTLGHTRAVAELAAGAGRAMGLSDPPCRRRRSVRVAVRPFRSAALEPRRPRLRPRRQWKTADVDTRVRRWFGSIGDERRRSSACSGRRANAYAQARTTGLKAARE